MVWIDIAGGGWDLIMIKLRISYSPVCQNPAVCQAFPLFSLKAAAAVLALAPPVIGALYTNMD